MEVEELINDLVRQSSELAVMLIAAAKENKDAQRSD